MMSRTIGALTAVAFATRFHNLSIPSYVCWDETHFGRMAGSYLNQTYFVDVHPPLGKMLLALAGLMTGYDGIFNFEVGDEYLTEDKEVHYYGMRAFCAICGSLVIPLLYSTVKTMTGSNGAAVITSALLILDCGLIALSQYILLDPILLFFLAASLFCNTKYSMEKKTKFGSVFSYHWWMFLALSGVSLGCMLAVKWVGLFTVAFVGCWTVKDLWDLLGNTKEISMKEFSKHFFARSICLIIIPICIYASIFAIHYQVLNGTGKQDSVHSSEFQMCLKGNRLNNASMPIHVAYGSGITLKFHKSDASGLLHSHNLSYPIDVMPDSQQQVTVYFYKDQNNLWEVIKPNVTEEQEINETDILQDGDIIRLRHIPTKLYLHSFARPSPISTNKQIVSCANGTNVEDKLNELWKIDVVKTTDITTGKIRVIQTKFRLIHVNSGCALHSSFKKLPDWAANQYEVVCSHLHRDFQTALWNVEIHYHRYLQKSTLASCQMTFLERFVESHLVMASSNSLIKPTAGDIASRPWQWPLNYKGQVFSFMGEQDLRVHLLGNPLIYFLNLVVIIVSPVFFAIVRIVELRELSRVKVASLIPELSIMKSDVMRLNSHHISACKWYLFGWFIHYVPFFLMSRALYFHHYYSAFIFSCCLSGCFLDLLFNNCAMSISKVFRGWLLPSTVRFAIHLIFGILLLESFYLYSPLCYGMTGPFSDEKHSMMYGLKVYHHWEI
uniref:protein O-mannosyl-transferase 2-like n=1 Tax=Styela clava TaxID=7725 RepID=UPI00193A7874|nr:protein O-mannosyl-transferase 2-like [Styela clava]